MLNKEKRQPAIRVTLLPRDTNPHGTIFGGIILSYIDQAGAVAAHALGAGKIVTVLMDKVVFHEPVFVGDLVSFYTSITRVGRTSVTTKVDVETIRPGCGDACKVTEAEIVYVHVDQAGKPLPFPDHFRQAVEAEYGPLTADG